MGQPAGSVPVESVIDLGELSRDGLGDRDPGRVRLPPRFRLAVILLLVATGLSGDAARLPLRPVLTTAFNATDFDIRGGVLYAFDSLYAPNAVSAYRLADGRRLWEIRSPRIASYAGVTQVGGQTLLVPNLCTAAAAVSTVAVDTASGREVWRRPGTPQQTISGGRLVLMTRAGGPVDCGGVAAPAGAASGYWDAVEAATGAVKWSIQAPDHARISFDHEGEERDARDARWIVVVAADGTVTTRDLLTGAIAGQVVLSGLAEPATDEPPRPDPTGVMLAGGQVLVIRELARQYGSRPSTLGITAYDVATLARRWDTRVETAPTGRRTRTDYRDDGLDYRNVGGCGPMLCARVAQTTVFLDPWDGAERWRTSMPVLGTTGGSVLIDPQVTAIGSTRSSPGGLTLRDARTGELRGTLRGWRISTDVRDDEPLLSLAVGDRTWFAWLDPVRVRVVAVGWVRGRYGSCTTAPGYLACRQLDGSVRVWQAPLDP